MQERQRRVTLRFSDTEYALLQEQTDIAALTVSEYIRRRTLGKRVASKLDLRVLAELRRLGGLLKHIHNESRGAYSKDTEAVLKAIESYIRTAERELREKR